MKAEFFELTDLIACTQDISLLTFRPLSPPGIVFTPGQYVEAILSNGAYLPLSIANTPRLDGALEFHVRHNPAHSLARTFLSEIKKNNVIRLQGPKGNCTLSAMQQCLGLLFMAGGTGFAPIKSLLESALTNPLHTSLNLYWGVRRPEDAYDEKTLTEWQKQYAQFRYTIVLSEPWHFPTWQGPTGLVPDFMATQHVLKDYCVFASGPFSMIERAITLFSQKGLERNCFFSDMVLINH